VAESARSGFDLSRQTAEVLAVSKKSARIAEMIRQHADAGGPFDPHYHGYFACFNEQLYFEAHDVLEEIWLPIRKSAGGSFYKGLIQLAGAFVHLQKNRLRPAAALFKLAQDNLAQFPTPHEGLNTTAVLRLIEYWSFELEKAGFAKNPFLELPAPRLELNPPDLGGT
jgi:predicted metal-dependent hydrolase